MSLSKIVCLGDSLTEGYEINTSERWTNLLRNDLQIEVLNKGISGDTTAGMLARFQTMVIAEKATHVIIFGGTNDIILGLKKNVIISNILAMVKLALYYKITPILGIPTSYYESENRESRNSKLYISPKKTIKRIGKLQETIKEFAKDREIKYIDFSKNLNSSDYLEDKLHPNNSGHLKMMINARNIINKYY